VVTAWLWYDARQRSAVDEGLRLQLVHGLLTSLLLQIIVTLGIKQLVRRPRPQTESFLYGKGPDEHSFPSGHAMRMGVVAGWAALVWPRFGDLFRLLALLIGWCRIRLGIHTLGDIAAGWLLGAAIVRLVREWSASPDQMTR
jgi:undecaprenyl-diphosphatase